MFNCIFHFAVVFLCTDYDFNFPLILLIILMAIGDTRQIFRTNINPFSIQPFFFFRKLLAMIASMQNHPHLIILNQKISTNTKALILLTQLVLQYQINCNTKATIIILSHKKTVKTYWDLDWKLWTSVFCIIDVCIVQSSCILYFF